VTTRLGRGLAASLVLAGCARERGGDRLEAEWQGDSLRGRLEVPAIATWCTGRSRLLVAASAGDSGFAVTVLPADSLAATPAAGTYPVGDPGAGTVPRPSAALALRRQEESRGAGYQSRSGSLELATGARGGWRAEFDGRIVSIDGRETLDVRGRFLLQGAPVEGTCDDTTSAGPPDGTLP
jgi:hypothetical protein